MDSITISTAKPREVLDITETIQKRIGIKNGAVQLQLLHTTAALTTADLDPGTDEDMLEAYWGMVPKLNFRHPHDPAHAPAHILASLIGPSLSIRVRDSTVQLGVWQRIVLVEFDGPKERTIEYVELNSA